MVISSLLASTVRGRHFWHSRYRVPPLQSGGIAECIRSFLPAFECAIILVLRCLLTHSIVSSMSVVDTVFKSGSNAER